MNPEDVTPEMYADLNKTYSNVLNELAWAFTLMPARAKRSLYANSIYEDITRWNIYTLCKRRIMNYEILQTKATTICIWV
jgi:hypothetical protein